MISIIYKIGEFFMVIIHIYVGTVVDWDSQRGGAGDTGGQNIKEQSTLVGHLME